MLPLTRLVETAGAAGPTEGRGELGCSYVTLSAYSIRSNITQMEAFVPDEATDKVHWFVVKCLWKKTLEVGKIVRIMRNTSLGMDADFHNEIVYSSSPEYFQQARRYQIQQFLDVAEFEGPLIHPVLMIKAAAEQYVDNRFKLFYVLNQVLFQALFTLIVANYPRILELNILMPESFLTAVNGNCNAGDTGRVVPPQLFCVRMFKVAELRLGFSSKATCGLCYTVRVLGLSGLHSELNVNSELN
ncbi:hypothetical protein Q9966_015114 [Columba livia]|nr:hypothetical protein Q9966_015114 [Columba livia]